MQISDPVRPSPRAHISAMLVVDPRHEGRTQIQKCSYNRTGVACSVLTGAVRSAELLKNCV